MLILYGEAGQLQLKISNHARATYEHTTHPQLTAQETQWSHDITVHIPQSKERQHSFTDVCALAWTDRATDEEPFGTSLRFKVPPGTV